MLEINIQNTSWYEIIFRIIAEELQKYIIVASKVVHDQSLINMESRNNHIVYIKNMVCRRCILAVEQILQSMGKEVVNVELGEVTLAKKLSEKDLTLFNSKLQMIGFEVLDDQKMKVIEKINK